MADLKIPVRLAPSPVEWPAPITLPSTTPAASQESFSELLGNAIDSVNQTHRESASMQQAMLDGEAVELHQVMIAAEKSSLSTELLLQVRNRLVNAYNQLVNMPM